MFRKKKKSNPYLYAGIKNRTDEPINEQRKSNINACIRRKLVVATVSLKHGAGCSHVGMAVANFLSRTGKEKTCFLNSGCGYVEGTLDDDVDSIYYPCNMSEIYSNYSYIIYDGGTINEIDKNFLDRSDIKLMLCWLNDEYVNLLADFIKSRNDINNWVFLFNNVPEKNQSKVFALMEDFSACCLPVFDASHIDKKIKMLFNKIFYEK